MSLANIPVLLWLIPLAGVIIALYLLRMRRRDVRVPATFLWPQSVEEIRANTLFQKLRFSWLLILQLLALSLVVFALARPQTRQAGLAGDVTVIVLDTSASMSAKDVAPSRFGEALRLARATIESAKATDRIALIEAGPAPRVVFPLGNDAAKQISALEQVRPTDAEADTGEALRLAAALVGGIDGARIVLLSDGCFERVANFSPGKAAVVYKSVGQGDENLAISALGAAETAAGRQLYVGVKSHSTKPMEAKISLYGDGKLIDSVGFQVGPQATWGRTVAAPKGARIFEAKMDGKDVLVADDYAATIVDPGASLRVLLVSKGDPFLERALALDPRVTLDKSTSCPDDSGEQYDLVVFDGVTPVKTTARGVLTFGAPGTGSLATGTKTVKGPQFVSAERVPLLDGVSFSEVFVDAQYVVSPIATATVAAETNKGPLVLTQNTPRQRQVYVTFEPLQSDFPLQVGFPIFVANALTFLAGPGGASDLSVEPGRAFSVPSRSEITITDPEGDQTKLPSPEGVAVVRSIRTAGVYKLQADGKTKKIFAALRSERESNVAPVADLKLGGGSVKASTAPARFADFWRPLVLLCLLVLGAEWWLFARKS